ncbi:outer membrane beta-barrel protein, partial [Flavobacterium sp.]|uniref:outer membrane beta-barrel protein n=1 Tax=Flavobacterium sp. TaxID=239 RepID=UPI003751C352
SANSSSLSLEGRTPSQSIPNVDFGNKNIYGIGFEVEYVFPYNNNKWAMYFEPTYKTKYEASKTVVVGQSAFAYTQDWFASYTALDLALGLRHYMYINESSKLFLNVSYLFNPKLNSKLRNNTKQEELTIDSLTSYNLGLGYNYNKKYSFEFRYAHSIKNDNPFNTKFKTISVVLGYRIFENNKNK